MNIYKSEAFYKRIRLAKFLWTVRRSISFTLGKRLDRECTAKSTLCVLSSRRSSLARGEKHQRFPGLSLFETPCRVGPKDRNARALKIVAEGFL